jgi:hypothetical protein
MRLAAWQQARQDWDRMLVETRLLLLLLLLLLFLLLLMPMMMMMYRPEVPKWNNL